MPRKPKPKAAQAAAVANPPAQAQAQAPVAAKKKAAPPKKASKKAAQPAKKQQPPAKKSSKKPQSGRKGSKKKSKKTTKKRQEKSKKKAKQRTKKEAREIKRNIIRNSRQAGRQAISDKLKDVLQPSEDDVFRMLSAQVHVGRKRSHSTMKRYVWKRRRDGFHVINLQKTWYKMILAARIISAIKDPKEVVVMSARSIGQRGAIKFAHYTGATSMVSKWVPGTFCNPQNRAFCEPRLLIIDDPNTCFGALRETSYMGIPVISFAGVDNNTKFVDCAIPCNNRGRLSVGLMFWMLAREVVRMRDRTIGRDRQWPEAAVDLFFYRDPDVIKKQQDEQKKQQAQEDDAEFAADRVDEPAAAPIVGVVGDQYPEEIVEYGHEQAGIAPMDWEQQPEPQVEDWGYDQPAYGYDDQQAAQYPDQYGTVPADQQAQYYPQDQHLGTGYDPNQQGGFGSGDQQMQEW